jgi:hypothetical protein
MGLHKASKRPKSPKINKMSIKMGNIRLFLLLLLKFKWFRPQMAFREFRYFNTCWKTEQPGLTAIRYDCHSLKEISYI